MFSTFLNSFQHIKHNWNDLNSMYSNIKHPNSDFNTKVRQFDL